MTRDAADRISRCFDFVSPPDDSAVGPARFCFCLPNERALATWPDFPRTALPETGRAAAGRGLGWDQCRVSALGEAVELASACAWGNEPLVSARPNEIGRNALDPSQLSALSVEQVAHRDRWNNSLFGQVDWFPPPVAQDRPVDWVAGSHAVTGDAIWVPADVVFVGRWEDHPDTALARADTSGCASAPNMAQARLHALCEVIERDATARWWHGHVPAAPLPDTIIADHVDLRKYLSDRPRRTRCLWLGSEFGPHTVVALSWGRDGGRVALGAASRFNPRDAALCACVEMLQTELGIAQRERAGEPLTLDWIAHVSARDMPPVSGSEPTLPPQPDPVSETALTKLIERLSLSGLTPLFVDLTRPAFQIPACRVLVPELCPAKPRFGAARMPKNAAGNVANPRPLAV
ncbi:YcaO-like family protein [Shimia biformata]|uniref:YcaO-like family protein n=1 Tax=Shimia biformata TaxID=1294299 RepID=UPI00194FCA26|nr:YcaO-like family protein [Shimia biformata]